MFKVNRRHLQPLLLSNVNDLPEKKRKRLKDSWAEHFYREFFSRINENAFAVLYVDYPSRPNVPINWLVGLETLKSGFGWSDEELYDHFCFDLQVRYALGIQDLNESDFDLRTLYYFRERLSRHNLAHGVNLLRQAFEHITDEQVTTWQVKTGKQRMDSTQIASNILDMTRLQLLVEALQRVHRSLSAADQQRYAETFGPYLQGHSGQYVYRLKGKEATEAHLQQIGEVIYLLLEELQAGYAQDPAYQVLERFFADNFRLEPQVRPRDPLPGSVPGETQAVRAKTNQELDADCLQSCDDLEATYRRKGPRGYKGYVANLSETCDPDNALQLITKVQVAPNTTADNALLLEALPDLKERSGLQTLYTDGPYAGPQVDQALQQHQVEQIQSGISGREPDPTRLHLADFEIQQDESGVPPESRTVHPGEPASGVPSRITCPQGQTVPVELSTRQGRYWADFDPHLCQACSFHLEGHCPARPWKTCPSFRLSFTPSQLAVAKRRRAMRLSQQDGKNHRAAIEGTIREVKHPFPTSKLPVRGLFRMTCLMVGAAAMTNVQRIHHYWEEKRKDQRRKPAAEKQGVSFSSFLKALWTGQRSFPALSQLCLCG